MGRWDSGYVSYILRFNRSTTKPKATCCAHLRACDRASMLLCCCTVKTHLSWTAALAEGCRYVLTALSSAGFIERFTGQAGHVVHWDVRNMPSWMNACDIPCRIAATVPPFGHRCQDHDWCSSFAYNTLTKSCVAWMHLKEQRSGAASCL